MAELEAERAAAVEALRTAYKNVGHTFYAAAASLGRDQTADTIIRVLRETDGSIEVAAQRVNELREVFERERNER